MSGLTPRAQEEIVPVSFHRVGDRIARPLLGAQARLRRRQPQAGPVELRHRLDGWSSRLHGPRRFHIGGLPVGLELMGRPFDEPTLIAIAAGYEAHTDHRMPPPRTPPLDPAHQNPAGDDTE